jgi:hypothetical protein
MRYYLMAACILQVVCVLQIGLTPALAGENEKKAKKGLKVVFSKQGTLVASAMTLFVTSKLTFTDERGRAISTDHLSESLKTTGGSPRNVFRFVFEDAKETRLETLAKLIDFLEANAGKDFETIVHIQIKWEKDTP